MIISRLPAPASAFLSVARKRARTARAALPPLTVFIAVLVCLLVPSQLGLTAFPTSLLAPLHSTSTFSPSSTLPRAAAPRNSTLAHAPPLPAAHSYDHQGPAARSTASQQQPLRAQQRAPPQAPPASPADAHNDRGKLGDADALRGATPRTDEHVAESAGAVNSLATYGNTDRDGDANYNDAEYDDGKRPALALPARQNDNAPPTPSRPSASRPLPQSQPLVRECGHVLLFTSPRHGSTWFLDNVEKCRFSRKFGGTFGNLNSLTEMWNQGQFGPVRNLTAPQAVNYLLSNLSLKIFPGPYSERRDVAIQLVEQLGQSNNNIIPVVILKRAVNDVYRSLSMAQKTGTWNRNNQALKKDSIDDEKDDGDERLNVQEQRMVLPHDDFMSEFFAQVPEDLENRGIRYDTLDYEDIKERQWIMLPKNGCYVRNCNFQ